MRKQTFLLYTVMAYLVGIAMGKLFDYHVLFILAALPVGYVLARGAIYEDKWNARMKEIREELEAQVKHSKEKEELHEA